MSKSDIRKTIKQICKTYWKVDVREQDPNWKSILEMLGVIRSHQLEYAFKRFAELNRASVLTNPLLTFINNSDKYIVPGTVALEPIDPTVGADDTGLDELCLDLCMIGEVSFTGVYRGLLAELRNSATDAEIKAAFTEFFDPNDEWAKKTVVKRFVEGGGKDFINKARKEAQLLKEQEALQAKLTEEFIKQRTEEVAAADLDDDVTEIVLPGAKQ
jgi:hypothetical protein